MSYKAALSQRAWFTRAEWRVGVTGLDALKIVALAAMFYEHALYVLMGVPTTLFGRIAFPLFLFAFVATLPAVKHRPWVMTRRWIIPAVVAQLPYWMTVGQYAPVPGSANMLLVFIGLAWLAWAADSGRVVLATALFLVVTIAAWHGSYGFVGPIVVLLALHAAKQSEQDMKWIVFGVAAAVVTSYLAMTYGLSWAGVSTLLVAAVIAVARMIPGERRLLPAGSLAWLYAGHLVVLGAFGIELACEAKAP